jgi:hypothetical protein
LSYDINLAQFAAIVPGDNLVAFLAKMQRR